MGTFDWVRNGVALCSDDHLFTALTFGAGAAAARYSARVGTAHLQNASLELFVGLTNPKSDLATQTSTQTLTLNGWSIRSQSAAELAALTTVHAGDARAEDCTVVYRDMEIVASPVTFQRLMGLAPTNPEAHFSGRINGHPLRCAFAVLQGLIGPDAQTHIPDDRDCAITLNGNALEAPAALLRKIFLLSKAIA